MTLAIRWGEDPDLQNGGFILMDAVTAYVQNYKGKVTSHPIANGGNVSDHFIRDNPIITISAVITGVDISTGTYLIADLQGNSPYNARQAPTAVSVNSTDQSVLQQLIPDSVGQFLPSGTPDVVMDDQRASLIEQIRQALIDLNSGVVYNQKTNQFDPEVQVVRLFEFDGSTLRKIINNLVITDITFKEDANSGEGLYCDIKFEQVTFAMLKKTTIPTSVLSALKPKAAKKADKGKQDGTPNTGDAPKDTDHLKKTYNQ